MAEYKRHQGHRQRMRERVQNYGLDSLADHEVLEYILYTTNAQRDTNEIAYNLLERFGDFASVLEASEEELCTVEGIGPTSARLQSCRGGADALHGAQFFLAGLQHRGKVPEPLQQVIRDLVGIPLSIGRIQDIFQHFMVGQTVQPVVLHPLPHALAVPLMPFVFCHGGSPFQRSFFIVPISGTELKPPGKIFRAGCVDLAGFVY